LTKLVCKLCVAKRGLRGSDIAHAMETEAQLFEHIESEHHMPVRRDDETDEQALERLRRTHPESADPRTCKCPACDLRREWGLCQ
jgi:hypothetical protein